LNFTIEGTGRARILDEDTGIELIEQPPWASLDVVAFEFIDPK
jgi:hypothetical protein